MYVTLWPEQEIEEKKEYPESFDLGICTSHILENDTFVWEQVKGISFELPLSSFFFLDLFMAGPKLFWRTIPFEVLKVGFVFLTAGEGGRLANELSLKFDSGIVHLRYQAAKQFDPIYKGLKVHISIFRLELFIFNYESHLLELREVKENHRLSCVVSLNKGGYRTILGRAQWIETGKMGRTRSYLWKCKENSVVEKTDNYGAYSPPKFPGVGRRGGLDDIGSLPHLAMMGEGAYVPDHDGIINHQCVLPLVLEIDDILRIQFVNGKFVPATFVETYFKAHHFIPESSMAYKPLRSSLRLDGSPRISPFGRNATTLSGGGIFKQSLSEEITIYIKWKREGARKISIRKIKLEIANYQENLNRWGEELKLDSI